MESEFLPSASAEEVMMPVESITNGAGGAAAGVSEDLGVVEYLEENDPVMGDTPAEGVAATTEEAEDADEADEEDGDDAVERKPTQQVPKKRKDAAILAEDEEDGDDSKTDIKKEEQEEQDQEEDQDEQDQEDDDEEEKPTSSARAANNKENNVDENQCRVCTAKEDLVSLFKKMEKLTVAELLMTICPTVSIARKDFMPQYICNPCLDNVTIATQLKTQCETTERELRKNLSRSKNKVRRPTGYVVINAHSDSDPPTEEEPADDVEFKVSDVEVSSAPENDDSDDSDFDSQKPLKIRRTRGGGGGGRGGRGRGGRRKSAVTTPQPKKYSSSVVDLPKKRGRPPPTKRSTPDSDDDEQPIPIDLLPKKKKKKMKRNNSSDVEETGETVTVADSDKPVEYPCDECGNVFTRKLSLVLHKKSHAGGREPINCEVCGKQFKIQGAYRTHLERHKNDTEATGFPCGKCENVCSTKGELRRHLAEEHDEPGMLHECNKCKRTFVSESRLERHKDGRCPGREVPPGSAAKHKKSSSQQDQFEGFAVGKDLFKSVAPLTSTYWSDSFSD